MTHTCASITCTQSASVVVVAGVPLCADHRRQLKADLTFPRARYRPKNGEPWFVYYVTWPHQPDVVKIGATGNPGARLGVLKKDGCFPTVLVIEPGSGDLETERHAQFADLCLSYRGEYFRHHSPLTEHIETLRRERPDWLNLVGRLPWWMNPAIDASSLGEAPKCAAPRADNGQPCSMTAGSGTDHLGTGRCRAHTSR